ncbi:MAG: hypothetical protein LBJ09_02060 [Clostridiales bacterium]|nr:hypothetical protein [Clostridiales bacterium]
METIERADEAFRTLCSGRVSIDNDGSFFVDHAIVGVDVATAERCCQTLEDFGNLVFSTSIAMSEQLQTDLEGTDIDSEDRISIELNLLNIDLCIDIIKQVLQLAQFELMVSQINDEFHQDVNFFVTVRENTENERIIVDVYDEHFFVGNIKEFEGLNERASHLLTSLNKDIENLKLQLGK